MAIVLAALLRRSDNSWPFTRFVFAFSAIFLLSMSGVYHLLPIASTSRHVFQRLDHAGIFLLIAGTFTAVHDLLFSGLLRKATIAAVWIAACSSIALKCVFFDTIPETLSLGVYLAFGWLGIFSAFLIYRKKGFFFLLPLVLGGVAYSSGALIDFAKIPVIVPGVVGPHELFHVSVLIGIALHWRFISESSAFEFKPAAP